MYALAFQTDSNHKIVFNQHIFQFLIFSTGHFTNRLDGFEARQNENQIMSSIVAPNASSSIKEIMMETHKTFKLLRDWMMIPLTCWSNKFQLSLPKHAKAIDTTAENRRFDINNNESINSETLETDHGIHDDSVNGCIINCPCNGNECSIDCNDGNW